VVNRDFSKKALKVRAPGRICLLGEHQDYLGLEVISGAMNLHVCLIAEPTSNRNRLDVHLEKTGDTAVLQTSETRAAVDRNYLQSGLNCMLSKGYRFTNGYTITIDGHLPIGKGVSSSSALCVGWIKLLAAISDKHVDLPPLLTAELAFESEVIRFNEPGGMQDHIASAIGGLLYMNFRNSPNQPPHVKCLSPVPGNLLLIDSGTSKDTLGMINRIRKAVKKQYESLFPFKKFNLANIQVSDLPGERTVFDNAFHELVGTLENLSLTRLALSRWPTDPKLFREILPPLLNEHHRILSEKIGSSSEDIDAFIDTCIEAGASAGKVIGSGGGGCILVYAPESIDLIIDTLEQQDIIFWRIDFDSGVSLEYV
jgi:galactokinase